MVLYMYKVRIKKKALEIIQEMPVSVQEKFRALVKDIENDGPVQKSWPNYSPVGKVSYHCHLTYRWVAVWRLDGNNSMIVEVYYVGSRENAPY